MTNTVREYLIEKKDADIAHLIGHTPIEHTRVESENN